MAVAPFIVPPPMSGNPSLQMDWSIPEPWRAAAVAADA
jgi:hypothetical protein